jgi:hypothetical protein
MPKKKKQATRKKSRKKTTPKRKMALKRAPSKPTTPKRKPRRIKVASKQSLVRKMKFSAKRKTVTSAGLVAETVRFPSEERREHFEGQAGDLRVEELLDEGNALEADALQGVESVLDVDEGEVKTHEVPEDDVPQEYLDKDR